MSSVRASTILALTFASLAHAADFLQRSSDATGAALLASITSKHGITLSHSRLDALEARLRPLYVALPKNKHNLLDDPAARYAVRRVMLSDRGWTIHMLDNTRADSERTLNGLLPDEVLATYHAHVRGEGFGLRDMALLWATMEHFIREDHWHALVGAAELLSVPTLGPISRNALDSLTELHAATFLITKPMPLLARHIHKMPAVYPGWESAQLLMSDEIEAFEHTPDGNPFETKQTLSLSETLRIVQQFADRFSWQQNEPECLELKDHLLEYERAGSGRVLLQNFYRADDNTRFFFHEPVEYLRAVGAIDDTNVALGPQVIVQNYVLDDANCMARSPAYAICCINECDEVMVHVERAIAAPAAPSAAVAAIVAETSSATVRGPRNLSRELHSYLDEIADAQGGRVHLHGRLFAQWLHFAFPRECPYPHISNTTYQKGYRTWKQANPNVTTGSKAGAAAVPAASRNVTEEEALAGSGLMWSSVEERYFADDHNMRSSDPRWVLIVRVLIVLLFALLVLRGGLHRGSALCKMEKSTAESLVGGAFDGVSPSKGTEV